MAKVFSIIMWTIFITSILFIAWIAISWIEVAFNNSFQIANENNLNFFAVLLKL